MSTRAKKISEIIFPVMALLLLPVSRAFADFTVNHATVTFNNHAEFRTSNISINAGGALNAGSSKISVLGNWANSGAFNSGTSTVSFENAAATSSVTGSTAFYSFVSAAAGKTISFAAGSTQTITNVFSVAGAPGNLVGLKSSADAAKWNVSLPNGPQTVSYADVKDSNALLHTVTAAASRDSGNNNANWLFGTAPGVLSPAPFSAVGVSSLTVNWGTTFSTNTMYYVSVSTLPNPGVTVSSGVTTDSFFRFTGLGANTSYYGYISTTSGAGYILAGAGATLIETPTSVYFDEVGTTSIVASAYVPTPAFTGLDRGMAGTNVAIGASTWAGWHGESWTSRRAMPTARSSLAAVAAGGKIYAVGGCTGDDSYECTGFADANEEYDPAADSWTIRPSMSVARRGLGGASVGGKIYAFGGENTPYWTVTQLDVNEEYDPSLGAWTTRASMPTGRFEVGAASLGGKVYALGGALDAPDTQTSANEVYNPESNVWTVRPDMHIARNGLAVGATRGKVYAIGGDGPGWNTGEEFDPAANSWADKAPVPFPFTHYAPGVAVGGKVYVVGAGESSTQNEEYDPVSDTWTLRAPMPTPRMEAAAAAVDGKIYAIGGEVYTGQDYKTVNEMYDPGVAAKFAALTPNTLYTFKAKARNLSGLETGESVSVSTYTLAAVGLSTWPALTNVFFSSATVSWASGSAAGGLNGPGATYKVQFSGLPDFSSVVISSITPDTSFPVFGLSANTHYYIRVQAYNAAGATDHSWLVLGSTVTLSYDKTPPALAILRPHNNSVLGSLAQISGTALDDVAVSSVMLSLKKIDSGMYWDGNGWNSAAQTWFSAALSSTAWIYSSPSFVYGSSYTIVAKAKDSSNNWSVVYATSTFSYLVAQPSASGSWITKTPMPTARSGCQSGVINGKLYVAAGDEGGVPGIKDALEMYDPGTNGWAAKAPMNYPEYSGAGGVIDNKLYIIGGWATGIPNGDLKIYDSGSNTWSTGASLPHINSPYDGGDLNGSITSAVVNRKFYLLVGSNGYGGYYNYFYVYDPDTNSWAGKSSPASIHEGAGITAYSGKIYVFGGLDGTSIGNTVEVYDPNADTWAPLASMPTASADSRAEVVGDKIYVIGGNDGSKDLNTVDIYSPDADSWSAGVPMPVANNSFASGVIDGLIYVTGGTTTTLNAFIPGTMLNPSAGDIGYSSMTFAWTSFPGATYAARVSSDSVYSGIVSSATVATSSAAFTGLMPNKGYYFEVRLSTETNHAYLLNRVAAYTHAAVPAVATQSFTLVSSSSLTLNWNANGNPAGTLFRAQLSTSPAFDSVALSSDTFGINVLFAGLTPETSYYARAAARNSEGIWTAYAALGATIPYVTSDNEYTGMLLSTVPFSGVGTNSLTVNWGTTFSAGTVYYISLSSVANPSIHVAAGSTTDSVYNFSGLDANTTYYGYVSTTSGSGYLPSGSGATLIETPTSVYFDELGTTTIVASAYALAPAFSGLEWGASGVNVALNGAYTHPWRGGNTWAAKAAMPTPRYGTAIGVISGRLYVVGGLSNGTYLKTNEEYDPVANAWTTKAAMPTARETLCAGVVGGKLYAVGGRIAASWFAANEAYDPAANAWTAKAAMPTARNASAVGAVGGKMYIVGGMLNDTAWTNANEVYDPSADVWTTKAVMPTARFGVSGGVINGKLYVVAGTTSSSTNNYLNTNEEYDPAADSWSAKAKMPTPRHAMSATVIGGKLYAIGGIAENASDLNINEEYDPVSDTWRTRSAMPTGRSIVSAGAAGGKVYVIGGLEFNGSGVVNTNEEYDPGVAASFTALAPNTQYSFKAKARNLAGVETGESSTVPAYTLAAIVQSAGPAFTNVGSSSLTVNWSSGTAAGGFNGPGAAYKVQVSTSADFHPVTFSSTTAGTGLPVPGLSASTAYYFRAQAYNTAGVTDYSWLTLGSTVTAIETDPGYNIITSTAVITPVDIAPENPLTTAKQAMGFTKTALYQGDGLTANAHSPVPMLRLSIMTLAGSTAPAYLKSLQVRSTGTLSASDIPYIGLYADNTSTGQVGMFDGEAVLGGSPTDIFIASGVYSSGSWTFNNLDVKYSTAIDNTPRYFFIAVRVSSTAAAPKSFSLAMDNQSFVVFNSSSVVVASNNFPIITATSPVLSAEGSVNIKGTDIGAWWQPSVGTTTLPLGQYNYVGQGQQRVGFLKLQAWTNSFTATLASFRVTKTGTGAGSDIKNVRLFLDSSGGDWTLGDGIFEPGIDKEVTDPSNPPAYNPLDPESFVLPLLNYAADGLVDPSTKTYFVAYDFDPAAVPGLTHGARVEYSNVGVAQGLVNAFSPIVSGSVPVRVPGMLSPAAFSAVGTSSLTVNWGTTFSTGTPYYIALSTAADPNIRVAVGLTSAPFYNISGLNANTTYYGYVSTTNGSGYLLTDSRATFAVVPSSAVFTGVLYSSAALSWQPGVNPAWTLYQYEISVSTAFGAIAVSGSGMSSPAWLTGLTEGTTYYGRVRAVNNGAAATAYAYTLGMAVTQRHMAPTGLASGISGAAMGKSSITWTWNSGTVASADYFALYSRGGVFITTVPFSSSASYDQVALDTNAAYGISVAGRNGIGNGPLAASATVYTLAAAPNGIAAVLAGNSAIQVSWNANGNPGATLYQLWRSTDASSYSSIVSTTGPYTNTGLSPATNYYYKVLALNGNGIATGYSGVASVRTPDAPLSSTPVSSGTAVGVAGILWSWNAVGGATGYRVVNSTSGLVSGNLSTGTFSWLETGLSSNTAYTRYVQAYNSVSVATSAAVVVYTLAAAPSGFGATHVYISSAALGWALNGNAANTTAQVWRSADNSSYSNVFEDAALTFTDTSLEECSTYYFKARNKSGGGTYSGYSSTLTFITLASTPTAPGGLSAESLDGGRIALTWEFSPSAGVRQYKLYYDNGTSTINYNSPWQVFSSTVSSWTTPALTTGQTYKFGLRAVTRCGIEEKNITVFASAQAIGSLTGVRAAIKDPHTGKRINGNQVTIMAELILGTPALTKQVRFQYRVFVGTGTGTWNDIVVSANDRNHPNPDTDSPYFVHWDASAMAENTYELRAVATDIYNDVDSAPPTITVVVAHGNCDINENVVSGEQQTETSVNNAVTNTVQAGDDDTSLLVKVSLPAGAMSDQTATLTLVSNPAAQPVPPNGAQDLNLSIKVDLSNGQHNLSGGHTATITLSYNDADDDGIVDGTSVSVDRLQLYYASSAAGPWILLDSTTVDTKKKTITGVTSHFSFFAAFGTPAANLDSVQVYPVPYVPNDGKTANGVPYAASDPNSGIIFDKLPAVVKIRIFTLSGQLVTDMSTSSSGGKVQWDVRNNKGKDSASGGYLAVISSPGNKTVVKKLLVIR